MTTPFSEPGRFIPGTVLAGRYRIIALVGRGGMGEVYRADDLKLGQPVALKFLPEAVERDEERLSRFLAEVRIARQISHPNVCRVYDVIELDQQHFLSMEYVDGEDLASLLLQIGRLPHEKAVQIARELCGGLHAAHEQGILHRDLKPANIMIDGRGRARITDFGLAGLADQMVGDEVRSGTPAYMSPEQLAGREVTVRSDLYALGLVLYELFTGRQPFRTDSVEALAYQRQETPPDTPSTLVPDLDPAVERAVMRCLQPDPLSRPSSALQLAAALPGGDPLAAALAAGETPSPELVAEAGQSGGLSPAAGIACLVAFLLGVAGIAFLAPKLRVSSMAPPSKPPVVLVERAREILQDLGHTERHGDFDHAYSLDADYMEWIATRDSSVGRWGRLHRSSPPPFFFWYRQSPRPLIPFNNMGSILPSWPDPPLLHSGMLRMVLSPQGDLQSFAVVPAARDSMGAVWPEPDWGLLFAAARLDTARFRSVPSVFAPSFYADRRAAWVGVDPGDSTIPLRIEATSLQGKPTSFSLYRPWDRAGREAPPPLTGWNAVILPIAIVVSLACLIGAAFLARRNVRLGRSDGRAALWLGGAQVMFGRLAWIFGNHHVRHAAEVGMFFMGLALDLLLGAVVWLVYLALEPYLRRLWPTTLISWIRLMEGRLRDPLVGRDVLVGCVAGVVFTAAWALLLIAPPWFGIPGPRPDSTPWVHHELGALRGPLNALGLLLYSVPIAFSNTLVPLVALLLMRLALRRAMPAYALWVFLMTVASPSQGNLALALLLSFVSAVLTLFVFLRFGLLTLVVATLVSVLTAGFPLTLDFGAWNASGGILALLTLVVLGAYGFFTALGGRRIFGDILPEARVPARAGTQPRS